MSVKNWRHNKPKKYYSTAVELFGKPTFVANVPYGMAYWRLHGNNLFSEHILRDEDIKHCVPKPHHDFFYTSIKLYVPPNKLLDVLKISGSINYDGLKHYLTARCGGLSANIATLYLGAKVAMGEYTINYVKKAGLYAKHIRGEAMSHEEMKTELMRLKIKNHHKYRGQLTLNRYPLAFTKC